MYTKAASHTIKFSLFDAAGDPILTAPTIELSQGSAAYAAVTNTAIHIDEEKWSLVLTAAESNCDDYTARITHADLPAPIIYSDSYPGETANVVQVNGVEVELGTGTGAWTVAITVNDGTNPLTLAKVRMTKGAESFVADTNSSGTATFNVDDGTWTIGITLVGYSYAGTTMVVNGNETATYSMTAISITPPSDATLCTVQFRVKLSNTAVSGAVCKAKLLGINQASDGTILSNDESSDTTDANGIGELQLVQKGSIVKGSGLYRITVTIAGKTIASVDTAIPNQSTCLFEDLL